MIDNLKETYRKLRAESVAAGFLHDNETSPPSLTVQKVQAVIRSRDGLRSRVRGNYAVHGETATGRYVWLLVDATNWDVLEYRALDKIIERECTDCGQTAKWAPVSGTYTPRCGECGGYMQRTPTEGGTGG